MGWTCGQPLELVDRNLEYLAMLVWKSDELLLGPFEAFGNTLDSASWSWDRGNCGAEQF